MSHYVNLSASVTASVGSRLISGPSPGKAPAASGVQLRTFRVGHVGDTVRAGVGFQCDSVAAVPGLRMALRGPTLHSSRTRIVIAVI